jgi:hypothetical protein
MDGLTGGKFHRKSALHPRAGSLYSGETSFMFFSMYPEELYMKRTLNFLVPAARMALLASSMIILALVLSCATVKNPNNPEPMLEAGDDVTFLNGTVWESEVQRGDLVAYNTYGIEGGTARFWVRMGNAKDEHEGVVHIVLDGNRITLIFPDGNRHSGVLESDRIVLDDGQVFIKVK